jgi:hypothetical protein
VQTYPVNGMGRKSRLSLLVTITIAAVQVRTKALANALHRPLFHRNVEVTRGINCCQVCKTNLVAFVRVVLIQSDVPSVPATFQEVIGYRFCPREHVG